MSYDGRATVLRKHTNSRLYAEKIKLSDNRTVMFCDCGTSENETKLHLRDNHEIYLKNCAEIAKLLHKCPFLKTAT